MQEYLIEGHDNFAERRIIAAHLKQARNKAGMTQAQVAMATPLTVRTLQSYENEEVYTPDRVIVILAHLYNDTALLFKCLCERELWRDKMPDINPADINISLAKFMDCIQAASENNRLICKTISQGFSEEWGEFLPTLHELLASIIEIIALS